MKKHEQLSELHAKNLEKQKKTMLSRRDFLRRDVRQKRVALFELRQKNEETIASNDGAGALFDAMQQKDKIRLDVRIGIV